MRPSEGMKIARDKGRLRGKPPKLSPLQEAHLVALYHSGEHTIADILELFPTDHSLDCLSSTASSRWARSSSVGKPVRRITRPLSAESGPKPTGSRSPAAPPIGPDSPPGRGWRTAP